MFLGWYGHAILQDMTFTEKCYEHFYVLLSTATGYFDDILHYAATFVGSYQKFLAYLVKKIAALARFINPARLWAASDESGR
jgi:hypothetical protein